MKVLCGEGLEVVPRVLWRTRRQSSISRCLLLAFARIAGLCPVLALVLALGPEFARWVPTPIRPPACSTRLPNQLPLRSPLALSRRPSALSVVPPAPTPQRLDATIVLDPLVSIRPCQQSLLPPTLLLLGLLLVKTVRFRSGRSVRTRKLR